MLKDYIMHFKNIVIFKFALCALLIIMLIGLLNYCNKEYHTIILNNHNLEGCLAEETLKLTSITDGKNKILKTYEAYSKLLSLSSEEICLARLNLISQIDNLSRKYNLHQPITITIKPEFLSKIESESYSPDDSIKLKNYDVKVVLLVQNFEILSLILKDIYSFMPKNTIVTKLDIKERTALEPGIIYSLSPIALPDMVYVKFNMRIREIVANR